MSGRRLRPTTAPASSSNNGQQPSAPSTIAATASPQPPRTARAATASSTTTTASLSTRSTTSRVRPHTTLTTTTSSNNTRQTTTTTTTAPTTRVLAPRTRAAVIAAPASTIRPRLTAPRAAPPLPAAPAANVAVRQLVPPPNPFGVNYVPYDPLHTENAKRIAIQNIMIRYDRNPSGIQPQDLDSLVPPIKPWHYKPLVPARFKNGHPKELDRLNEKRRAILEANGRSTRGYTQHPLRTELVKYPTLARNKETQIQLETIQKKEGVKVSTDKGANPNTARTYFPALSRKYSHIKAKVDSNSPVRSNKGSVHYFDPRTGFPAPPPLDADDADNGQNGGANDIPSTPPVSPSKAQPQQGDPTNSSGNEMSKFLLLPPFLDEQAKCSAKEGLEFFKKVHEQVKQLTDHWLLSITKESHFRKIDTVIPNPQRTEIALTNADAGIMSPQHIVMNNAFLLDAIVHAWFQSCVTEFGKTPKTEMIDMRPILSDIMKNFMAILKNGVYLPPLDMEKLMRIQKKRLKTNSGDKHIVESMIPLKHRVMYAQIIGKRSNAIWRMCEGHRITFIESLDFLPNKKLTLNLYESLQTRFRRLSNASISDHIEVILWSELEPIQAQFPEPKRVQVVGNQLLENLRDKVVKTPKLDKIYISIVLEDLPHLMLRATPDSYDIGIFMPQATEHDIFGEWVGRNDSRLQVGLVLKWVKKLFEKIFNEPKMWCMHEVLDADVPPGVRNEWPWNDNFIETDIILCKSVSLSPIACLIWLEQQLQGEDNWNRKQIIDEDELEKNDARMIFFNDVQNHNN